MSQAPKTFQKLIDLYGESKAKQYLRYYYSQPKNLPAFAMLMSGHVPKPPPQFHRDIWSVYTTAPGHVGGAAPRGFAKSTITSTIYLLWRTVNATSRFSILAGDTYTQATEHLDSIKDEIENNVILQWLYGDLIGDTWSDNEIIVKGIDESGQILRCKVVAVGAGQKVRGRKFLNFRPQLLIIDDLENDEAVQSKERRDKLRRWLVRAAMPAVDKINGKVILIGTVLHQQSLLSTILKKADEFTSWTTFKYSAITDGQSLWPERYDTSTLEAMRDDREHPDYMGVLAFAQEMMNEPLLEGDQIIRPEWLEPVYHLGNTLNRFAVENDLSIEAAIDAWIKRTFREVVASVDPAISEKDTADFWAMASIGITNECPVCNDGSTGHIMQLDMLRMKESDPLKQVQAIIENYLTWQHDRIRIEAVAYQAGLVKLIKREAANQDVYMPIKPFRPAKSKRSRVMVQAANFSGGMVHLRSDHPLYQDFKDEILQFPQGEHDDMLDAFVAAAERAFKRKGKVVSG